MKKGFLWCEGGDTGCHVLLLGIAIRSAATKMLKTLPLLVLLLVALLAVLAAADPREVENSEYVAPPCSPA